MASLESTLNSESRLYHLYLTKEGVRSSEIKEDLTELNCDQILGSEVFGHISYLNAELPQILKHASGLAAIKERSPEQEEQFIQFKEILKSRMFPKGRTLIERIVEREYYKELESEIASLKSILGNIKDDQD